ncbi:putative spermidine/putrescine transport system substrate-binding protein [Sporobacter termitidis DSM 10068]|uniref:Putative spermidine/putrescine transport system substrate-binding protein n=1 Tax=Sporobacter termitidis DSM 10068 TaxID=1123282 RepID=A0A1M5URI1_9FIRM|nr:ABC transporter substrate-binding protein [Sporobacter termitidis]SHH65571.1 putative spermidine/putrescine transport system substrate-binding protein [Sporobacter termitidis DSM 10068]
MKLKRVAALLLALILGFTLFISGCGRNAAPPQNQKGFDAVVSAAKGTTVNFYSWGGDEKINKWIDTVLAKNVKDNYGITLKRIPMDDTQTAITKLMDEKQSGVDKGSIDMLWVNGENFYTAKENGLFYGPFTAELPNFQKYIDQDSDDIKYDFGVTVDGMEAPYAKAQFVFINDSSVTPETPKNAQELLEYAKKYKGKVTYPAPPDFTGSVFVRQIIYDVVGYDKVNAAGTDKEKIKAAIQPAMDYLKELKPYLWKEGKTYPASSGQLDNMFADGEVVMDMNYDPNTVAAMIDKGTVKDTARDFIFDKGMIGNTSFLAIPANAPNKEGAMAVINAILTPELQASKYDPSNWGALPVLDNNKLSDSEKQLFDKIPLGKGVIPQSTLLSKRQPELPASVVPIIEEIWQSEIPNK